MVKPNAKRFGDRVALVTGSTRGIGAAIAKRLAAEGAAVTVSGRSVERGRSVAEDIRSRGHDATFVRADMREPEDIEALVEQTVSDHGRLDVLVNNAAVQTETGIRDATLDDWDAVIETDFRAYWLCAREAVARADLDAIINVSSNHAHHTMPDIFPYNAVKAGIEG